MKKIRDWLFGIVLLTILICLSVPSALATPPALVDIESFSVGDVVAAQIKIIKRNSNFCNNNILEKKYRRR